MEIALGHFDQLGNPCLKFYICGVMHPDPGVEFEAIIDTGFNGFLSVPLLRAFPLGLPLCGTTSATLADGSQNACLTALAKVSFGDQRETGVVMLDAGSQEVLLGLDFLRRFKLALYMTKDDVILYHEDFLDKFKKSFTKASAAKPKAAPPAGSSPESEKPSGQTKGPEGSN